MDTIQKIFENELNATFSFSVIGAKLIRKQLEKKGVILTENQVVELERKLLEISGDSVNLNLDLDEEQIKILGISDSETVKIDIGGEIELDDLCQELIEEAVPQIINETTGLILSSLREKMPVMLKTHKKTIRKFEKRLHEDWKKPFNLFEVFLILAIEAGDEFNSEFRKEESEAENYIFEALTRLHARACQVASEIFVLIKSGFADGAHARWRSLHEIAVVASFIKTHGNEVAERYLLHNNIELYRAATLYLKHYESLGMEPIPPDEYDSIKTRRDKLIERFEDSYKNNYGWASKVLGKKNPNFLDIEENSRLDHLRPYYKLASHNVHANPKGIMFKLGLFEKTQNILLAGPSNFGFTDPAQGTVFSLGLITVTLITLKPTVDNIVFSNILLRLETEIGEEFFKVQKEIEDRDAS